MTTRPLPILSPILIYGPTASGKSGIAIGLAQRLGGVVINADSMQVYDALSVLTAQPTKTEQQLVPHRLFGAVSPTELFNTGKWLRAVLDEISKAHEAGFWPILVGGTGLYFKAFQEGLAEIPDVPIEVRKRVMSMEDHALRDVLPFAPDFGDRQRLMRQAEVFLHTGKTLGEWTKNHSLKYQGPSLSLALWPNREILYQRINQRFADMMQSAQLWEELQAYRQRCHQDSVVDGHPLTQAIGLPELERYLTGHWTREQTVEKAAQATRRYAKRQYTWLRGSFHGQLSIPLFGAWPQPDDKLLDDLVEWLRRSDSEIGLQSN